MPLITTAINFVKYLAAVLLVLAGAVILGGDSPTVTLGLMMVGLYIAVLYGRRKFPRFA